MRRSIIPKDAGRAMNLVGLVLMLAVTCRYTIDTIEPTWSAALTCIGFLACTIDLGRAYWRGSA